MSTLYLAFLAQHDDGAWHRLVDRLEPSVHPVDRAAVRIWFHLFPLALQRAIEESGDAARLARTLALAGRWRLADQIHTSHRFLYGHRFWPEAREAVAAFVARPAAPDSLDVAAHVKGLAGAVSDAHGLDAGVLTGIIAVALRTVQQVGLDAFRAAPAAVHLPPAQRALGPGEVLDARARLGRRGLLDRLRGGPPIWPVVFDEADPAARFPLVDSQHLTTAAGQDARDYRARDVRCSEGPIPVHCRSCSCGTCWVGVLSGREHLSPMDARERETLAECGYAEAAEPQPVIRLACMAQAAGPVTLVIPPWNGRVGRIARGSAPSR
ncbi:MAG: hypothetical protein AB1635_01625 [Acidobacteriota bacterium]